MTLGGSIRSTLDGSDGLFRSAEDIASAPDGVRCYVNANYYTDSVLDICLMHIERNHLIIFNLLKPAFNVACAVLEIYANRGRLKMAFIIAIYKANEVRRTNNGAFNAMTDEEDH
ncbi:hypothetical protein T05_5986 [Trichinella murrelli]|uniref:Uncharacterized protein n=1 Tax=Trichinella murrelli TaxID=144512 RepID=A0A0V0U5Q7_9BILA|nr:hypothetical protein T05_5986 [Trichinella murrelli]